MSTILAFFIWLMTSVTGALTGDDVVEISHPSPPPAPAYAPTPTDGPGFSNGI